MAGAKVSKNQRVGASAPKSRNTLRFETPLCGYCGAKTARTRPKWRVCETGHKLYKLKGAK
jgi:hypothetical protein